MAFLSIQVATHLIQPLPPQKNANRTLPTLVMKSTIEAITIDYIRLQVENYLVFASIYLSVLIRNSQTEIKIM